MENGTSESICIYGAGVLLKHLDALSDEVEGVKAGAEDIEFIHRARVASRRLRSAIPLFDTCLPRKKKDIWMKRIKKVTRALGEARDTDVQTDVLKLFLKENTEKRFNPGITRLLLRLRQKRAKIQPQVEKAMQKLIQSQVMEEMKARLVPLADRQDKVYLYTPALYAHAYEAIAARLDAFMAYDDIVNQPEKVTELHEMRIAAKWLRYTLENLSSLYSGGLKGEIQTVRKVQDALGMIHDCDVWLVFLPEFMEDEKQRTLDYFGSTRPFSRLKAGLEQFRQNRQDLRDQTYRSFVDDWQQWKDENVWQDLNKRIQAPFFESMPQKKAEDLEKQVSQSE